MPRLEAWLRHPVHRSQRDRCLAQDRLVISVDRFNRISMIEYHPRHSEHSEESLSGWVETLRRWLRVTE